MPQQNNGSAINDISFSAKSANAEIRETERIAPQFIPAPALSLRPNDISVDNGSLREVSSDTSDEASSLPTELGDQIQFAREKVSESLADVLPAGEVIVDLSQKMGNLAITSTMELMRGVYNTTLDVADLAFQTFGDESHKDIDLKSIKPFPTNREAIRYFGSLSDYDANQSTYDVGGTLTAVVGTGIGAAAAMTKGSTFYNTLSRMGVSDRVLKWGFADLAKVRLGVGSVVDDAAKLAINGIKPQAILDLGRRVNQVGWQSFKESLKLTASTEAVTAAAFQSNDMLYNPLKSTKQKVLEYGLLPVALGSIGTVADFAIMRRAITRGAKTASEVKTDKLKAYFGSKGSEANNYRGIAQTPSLDADSANLSTLYSYELNGMRAIEEDALKQAGDLPESTIKDIKAAFSDERRVIENKRLSTAGNLVSPSVGDQKSNVVSNVVANLSDKPNLLMGVDNISLVPTTNEALDRVTGNAISRKAKLEKKIANARKPEAKAKYEASLDRVKDTTFSVLKQNGEVVPAASYHVSFRDNPENLRLIKTTTKDFGGTGKKMRSQGVTLVDEDNVVHNLETDIAGNLLTSRGNGIKPYSRIVDYTTADAGWGLLQKQLDDIDKYFDKSLKDSGIRANVKLSEARFQQLDYLVEAYERLGEDKFNKFFNIIRDNEFVTKEAQEIYGESFDTLDLLKTASLSKKRDNISYYMSQAAQNTAKSKFSKYPIDSVFEEIFNLRPSQSNTISDVVTAASNGRLSLADFAEMAGQGDRLRYKPQKPILLRSNREMDLSDKVNDIVFDQLASRDYIVKQNLKGINDLGEKTSDLFVNKVANDIYAHPAYETATKIDALAFGTERLGRFGKYLLQNTFRAGENLTQSAMAKLSSEVSLHTTKLINDKLKPLSDVLTPVISDQVKTDQMTNFIHQMRSGWVAKENGLVKLEDGKFAILLDPSKLKINQRVAARQALVGGKDFSVGDYVPDPFKPWEPLVFDQETAAAIEQINQLSNDLWVNQNHLNTTLGKRSMPYRPYHVPAKDLSDKSVKVITDLEGRPITYVAGNTNSQAMDLARREQSLIREDTKIADLDSVEARNMLMDSEADWSDMSDFSDMVNQYGSKNQGKAERTSVGGLVNTGKETIREVVEGINRQYHRLARRTRRSVFQGQLDHAFGELQTLDTHSFGRDALEQYVSNALGTSMSLKKDTTIGKAYGLVDSAINLAQRGVNNAFYKLNEASRQSKLSELKKMESSLVSQRKIDKLFANNDELKTVFNFSEDPITDAIDYLKRINPTAKIGSPKSAMGTVNRYLSMSMLRIANLGFALTNMVSLPATLPAVLRSYSRRPYETMAEHQARIGAFAKDIPVGDADFVTNVDLMGSTIDTINWMFSKDFKRVNDLATEYGYFDTSASLMNEIFVDPTKGRLAKAITKGVDAASFLSDKSESLSRSIPFFMGYRIAEKGGLKTDKARFAFAKQFMDDVVGNYQAVERPLTHSQGLGLPMALFATYTQNVGQRLFDYVENKDTRALLVQAFSQSLVFGTKSLPASGAIENYFLPIDSGKDFYSSMNQEFGDDATRAFLYGPMSAYTGLDFSSKGSLATIRSPIIPNPKDFVGTRVATDLWQGMSETLKSLSSETGLSPSRLAEIWQSRLPSPMAKSAIDIGLGYTTNRAGEVVVDYGKTREGIGLAANLMAMKTLDETLVGEKLFKSAQRQRRQSEAMATVRQSIRTFIRDSGFRGVTGADDKMLDLAVDYINAGGKPERFLEYLSDQMPAALMSKSANEIEDLISKGDSSSLNEALALLSLLRTETTDGELSSTQVPSPSLDEFVVKEREFF